MAFRFALPRRTGSHWLAYARTHRALSSAVFLVLLGAGYFGYTRITNTDAPVRYVLASVKRGAVIASIAGTGQVSASNQVDIKAKASGDVLRVLVQNGQELGAGMLIAELDARDAEKVVRDAEADLESARIAQKKLEQPADALSILQAENSLTQAKSDLTKAYDDGFNAVADAFLDLPTVMTGLQDMFYSSSISAVGGGQWNIDFYMNAAANYDDRIRQYRDDADAKYQQARKAYDRNLADYKAASRSSDPAAIEALIGETYETSKAIADAVKSGNNLIQFYQDTLIARNLHPVAAADTHRSTLATYTGYTNSHLSELRSIRDTITQTTRTITERTISLADLKSGADALDRASQRLTVTQRENALTDAREKLSDYAIRAPFDGVIAKLNIARTDPVTSGTAVATFITRQKLAAISLNEVDVARVRVRQKATLTFDAIDGLSIAGAVAEIDAVGTVTQGVVTYNVTIAFDTQDDRVKTGMSVSAAIITDVRQDVLTVPQSAVKAQSNTHYVEIVDQPRDGGTGSPGVTAANPPRQHEIEIGLSDDTSVEVISGLKEGDQVVSRTVAAGTSSQSSPQAPSLFGAPRGGGGGAVRIPR